jgi:hypothetical protein
VIIAKPLPSGSTAPGSPVTGSTYLVFAGRARADAERPWWRRWFETA